MKVARQQTMTNFIAIEDLLHAHRGQSWPVVLTPGSITADLVITSSANADLVNSDSPSSSRGKPASIVTRHEWLHKVSVWRALLQQRQEQNWALYHPDAGEFSIILFALWSLGKTAYLPASRQPALLESLALQVDAFIGDFDNLVETPSPPASLYSEPNPQLLDELAQVTLDCDATLLKVYTSGSSGEPQAIPKTIRQLSSETIHLETLWGKQLASGQSLFPGLVLATVSHQHIYGLLFRVLWPLAAGRCFDAHTCEYLEEIKFRAWQDWPLSLISSPTHLSRIPALLDEQCLKKLSAVFSSGAPLERQASLLARQHFGLAISEVYGSSETGGIAWRQQSPESEASWQAMPGVQVRKDAARGTLDVRSNHLPDAINWQQTEDRVQFNKNGQFTLLGRADRIVKVEGKRTSLDEMETSLLRHPWVEAARLLMFEGRRSEIAAVVVLSNEAKNTLSSEGKRHINELLRKHLLLGFERPVLPRRWRYIKQLPFNSQGKLEQKKLVDLFADLATNLTTDLVSKEAEQSAGNMPEPEAQVKPKTKKETKPASARTQLPTVLDTQAPTNQELCLQLHIPEDLLFFDGHFDNAPILPGVVQIHWAEHFARQAFAPDREFLRLEAIKFKQIIRPDQLITLKLNYDSANQKITFVYYSELGPHANGRIVLGNKH